jgi:hypothetical protein
VNVTSDNVGPLIRAAMNLLRSFGIEPDMGEP